MKKVTFYHAGCPVCINAEKEILNLVDRDKTRIDIVHLGEEPSQLNVAEDLGVQSVPALVLENKNVLHINFGAALSDLKS